MRFVICLCLLSCSFLISFSACKKELVSPETPQIQAGAFPDVPTELWDYFRRFEIAAAERGRTIDLAEEGISAEFIEIAEPGVAGTCTYGSHQPGHIVIDESFWNQTGDLYKEMIVFHELGHCSLHLDHREGVLPNGACASIMRSGLEDCIDNYRSETREAYLDELFSTP